MEYKINKKNRTIAIGGLIPAEVIVYYVSTGLNSMVDAIIPREAVPSLKAYIHWKRLEYLPNM